MNRRWSWILVIVAGCFKPPEPKRPDYSGLAKPKTPAIERMERDIDGARLVIEILKQGDGQGTKGGETVHVHYEGTFSDGRIFDSSIERGRPFSFVLGESGVIRGWHEGVLGMKVGEKRRLTIPPQLGYGDRRTGVIPPNSTLTFEIELIEIE